MEIMRNNLGNFNYHCLYCSGLHSLLQCNDQRLQRFESLCRAKKYDYEYSQVMFKNWLHDHYNNETDDKKRTVIYFAAKNTNASVVGIDINEIIQKITDIIFDNRITHEMEQDFIPFTNHVEYEYDENGMDLAVEIIRYRQRQPYRTTKNIQIILNPPLENSNIFNEDCSVCMECKPYSSFVSMNCNHQFCECCVEILLKNESETKCPFCRCSTTHVTVPNEEIQNKFISIVK